MVATQWEEAHLIPPGDQLGVWIPEESTHISTCAGAPPRNRSNRCPLGCAGAQHLPRLSAFDPDTPGSDRDISGLDRRVCSCSRGVGRRGGSRAPNSTPCRLIDVRHMRRAPEKAMPARLVVSTMGTDTARWSQSAVLSPVQMGPTCAAGGARASKGCAAPPGRAQV